MNVARKHNAKGRSTGEMIGKRGRGNKPPAGKPFVWITLEMLESPAWRSLSINARRVLDRLMLEHAAHAGTQNGELICTYNDFQAYGVTRRFISKALKELQSFGFIRVTHGDSNGAHRPPNRYRLTWLGAGGYPATNEWKGITEEDVKARVTSKRGRKKQVRTPRL